MDNRDPEFGASTGQAQELIEHLVPSANMIRLGDNDNQVPHSLSIGLDRVPLILVIERSTMRVTIGEVGEEAVRMVKSFFDLPTE